MNGWLAWSNERTGMPIRDCLCSSVMIITKHANKFLLSEGGISEHGWHGRLEKKPRSTWRETNSAGFDHQRLFHF